MKAMIKKKLITTAEKSTWRLDDNVPVLFLGEWCKRFSDRDLWENSISETLPYHWDNRSKLQKDYEYLTVVYEELLVELSSCLNHLHNTNKSIRFWRILIGPWLINLCHVIFDRLCMLELALEVEGADYLVASRLSLRDLVPNDQEEFEQYIFSDAWNECVYREIVELVWKDKIHIDFSCNENSEVNSREIKSFNRPTEISGNKKLLYQVFEFGQRFFGRYQKVFFLGSYLPKKVQAELDLRMGQIPLFYRPVSFADKSEIDWSLRDDFSVKLNINNEVDRFRFVTKSLVPQIIPKAYLEGLRACYGMSKAAWFPNRPDVIFTSNSYQVDEVFKVWAAENVEKGSKLIVGQHGGHYGTSPLNAMESHQKAISDFWVSWGWKDSSNKVIPWGNFKDSWTSVTCDPNGGALLTQLALNRYSYSLYGVPLASQFLHYLNDQFVFLDSLRFEIQREIIVRLGHHDYGWDIRERWLEQNYPATVTDPFEPIDRTLSRCRIYISTYNATTFLEALTWNFPVLIFWDPRYFELTDEVNEDFCMLEREGIFHRSPESAARHLSLIWDDVAGWWNSSETQSIVQQFREKYAKPLTSTDGLVDLLMSCRKKVAE